MLISYRNTVFVAFLITVLIGCSKSGDNYYFPDTTPSLKELVANNLHSFSNYLITLPVSERDSAVINFISLHPSTPVIENNIAGIYYFGEAKTVVINGDLQRGWSKPDTLIKIQCSKGAFFYKLYKLPLDARADYLLYVDGKETLDKRNPAVTPGFYSNHSQIAMPGFKSSEALNYIKNIPHGTIDTVMFSSRMSEIKPRNLFIYKPAGYEKLSKLPVLYVYNGPEFLQYSSINNVLDNLIAWKRIEPVLVVFIGIHPGDMQYLRDGSTLYPDFLADEIIPYTDKNYKTDRKADRRGVLGISIYGTAAFMTVSVYPDEIHLAAGQSPTISEKLIEDIKSLSENSSSGQHLKFYIDAGKYDLPASPLQGNTYLTAGYFLHNKLKESSIKSTFSIYNDGHQWANWRERTENVLTYFFPYKN